MKITDFEKGDEITRSHPVDWGLGPDYGIIGAKFVFLGIENGCVYLNKKTDFIVELVSGLKWMVFKIPIIISDDDHWQLYIEPFFIEDETNSLETRISEQIKESIEREDYIKADILKKKLDELLGL